MTTQSRSMLRLAMRDNPLDEVACAHPRKPWLILVPALFLIGLACGASDEGSVAGGTNPGDAVATSVAATSDGQTGAPTTTMAADNSGEESVANTTSDVQERESSNPPTVGDAGSFSVNGEQFVVTSLNRCIPFRDDEGNIDLQAIAQTSGSKLNLNLAGGVLEASVDGSGVRDAFGSVAFGKDPVIHDSVVDGDRWTGSATLGDTLDSGETVEVTWDVMIPAETQDCSF